MSNGPDKKTETRNLHTTLKLAVGAGVMLTVNVDISDGLVNGARGEVVHVAVNKENSPITILVKFDNQTTLDGYYTPPISLTFAWATTIHEVLGLTLYEIVVDLKGGHFNVGQAYVAFRRVKSLQVLHILSLTNLQ
uniref:ATP-dependent DNA helicase n=1 Tax=Amphimedon queenslandica TaxID=400682 RepID=A0A1X7VSP1_AMPQE